MKRYVIVTNTQRVIFTPKVSSEYFALYWACNEAPYVKRIKGHEEIKIIREEIKCIH